VPVLRLKTKKKKSKKTLVKIHLSARLGGWKEIGTKMTRNQNFGKNGMTPSQRRRKGDVPFCNQGGICLALPKGVKVR